MKNTKKSKKDVKRNKTRKYKKNNITEVRSIPQKWK